MFKCVKVWQFKRFLKKTEQRIFDDEIEILSIYYELPTWEIRRLILEAGWKSQYWSDRFCHFAYFIKSEGQKLTPMEMASTFADEKGTISILDCYLHGESI